MDNQIELDLNIAVKPNVKFGIFGNEYMSYCGECGGVIEEDYVCCPYCTKVIDWSNYKQSINNQIQIIKNTLFKARKNYKK